MYKTQGAYNGAKRYFNDFDYTNFSLSPKKERQDELANAAFGEEIAIEIKGLNEDTSRKSKDSKGDSNDANTYGGL